MKKSKRVVDAIVAVDTIVAIVFNIKITPTAPKKTPADIADVRRFFHNKHTLQPQHQHPPSWQR